MEETIAVQLRHPAMQERQFGDDGDGDDSDDGDDNDDCAVIQCTPFNNGIITGRL